MKTLVTILVLALALILFVAVQMFGQQKEDGTARVQIGQTVFFGDSGSIPKTEIVSPSIEHDLLRLFERYIQWSAESIRVQAFGVTLLYDSTDSNDVRLAQKSVYRFKPDTILESREEYPSFGGFVQWLRQKTKPDSTIHFAARVWLISDSTSLPICPVCGDTVEVSVGALAVGETDPYSPDVGWIPSYSVYVCKNCGAVFVREKGRKYPISHRQR